jgi:DNA-binding protein HU-beta
MNKTELVALLAINTGTSQKTALKILDEFLNIASNVVANGEKLQLVNFGSLTISNRKERLARNPKTNQPLIVPEHKSVRFNPGKALKERLNPDFKTETIETDYQPVIIL